LEPRNITKEKFAVVGIQTDTSYQNEIDPATGKIGPLWQKFFAESIGQNIPNRKDQDTIYGVYTNYKSDYRGLYSLTIGAEVNLLDEIPPGMLIVEIPAASYLVFTAEGEMPQAIISAWNEIWMYFSTHTSQQRAYTTDFEVYDANHPQRVEIYIAVK